MDLDELELVFADYVMDLNFPDKTMKYADRFEKTSLIRWALDELYMYIRGHPNKEPLAATKDFIGLMRKYMYAHPKTQHIFFNALDVARDIYEILLCAKSPRNTKGEDYEQICTQTQSRTANDTFHHGCAGAVRHCGRSNQRDSESN